jgi:hypothetical protein
VSTLRRVRGTLSIGLFWGLAWATCGGAFAAWRVLFGQPHFAYPMRYLGRFVWTGGTVLGACGLVAGAAFALALSRVERDRDVAGLSPRRAAMWGTLAGAVAGLVTIPLLGLLSMPVVAVGAGIMAAVGSISAFGTVRLAQREGAGDGRGMLDDPRFDRSTIARGPT